MIVSGCSLGELDDTTTGCASDNESYELFTFNDGDYHFSFRHDKSFEYSGEDQFRPLAIRFKRPYYEEESDIPLSARQGTNLIVTIYTLDISQYRDAQERLNQVRSALERREEFAVEDVSNITVAGIKTKQWTFSFQQPDYVPGTVSTSKHLVFDHGGLIWEISSLAIKQEDFSELDSENWKCVLNTFKILD